MPTTIFDVAELANVSSSTVSRVLNGRDHVHPQIRPRVQQAIRELDYQQTAPAPALATGRSEMLGLLIPQVNAPFPYEYEVVRGVADATSLSGYSLLIANQPRQYVVEEDYLRGSRYKGMMQFLALAERAVFFCPNCRSVITT